MMTTNDETPSVYVVATTEPETRHAVDVARILAHGAHRDLTVIVSPPQRLTVSSARAHVHEMPVEDLDPRPPMTPEEVRGLLRSARVAATVLEASWRTAAELASFIPAGSTIVLCGPCGRFWPSLAQRLARQLSRLQFRVVFLPYARRFGPAIDLPGLEVMRRRA
jgi:hypothetical protein